jgi:hypothetical protein
MRIVKTWCENTKEGMSYLNYNNYKPICRLTKKLWLTRQIGNSLSDIVVIIWFNKVMVSRGKSNDIFGKA